MNTMTRILTLSLVLSLSACAKRPGNNAAYDDLSDRCSSEFISDYNSLVYSAKSIYSESSLDKLETEVEAFGKKYAGVACRAVRNDGYSSDSEGELIDADTEVSKLKTAIANAKSKLN